MSRHARSRRSFGGPSGGDWLGLGAGVAATGFFGTRIVRKTRYANERRRQYEEEMNDSDLVEDYDRGYYLRESY